MNRCSTKKAQLARGSGLIEFALLSSSICLLTLGIVDFSLAITNAINVTSAAQAGVRYGAAEGNSNDTDGMAAAAARAASEVPGITAKAITWCACSAGGSPVSCSTVCNMYDLPAQYVQVRTSASIPLFFKFPGIPLSIPMAGSATMRAR
jgi:Flp pilus assembly protein TadG